MASLHRLVLVLFFATAWVAPPFAVAQEDSCVGTFGAKGNMLSGKTFDTTRVFPMIAPTDALKRGYAFLKNDGMAFAKVDSAAGSFAAVDPAKTKNAPPFSFSAQAGASGGSVVRLSYAFGPGQFASEGDTRKYFCSLLTSIEQTATPEIEMVMTIGASQRTTTVEAGQGQSVADGSRARFVVDQTTETQIAAALDKAAENNKPVGPVILDAKPVLTAVFGIEACAPSQNIRELRRYADSDATCSGAVHMPPMSRTKNHGGGTCLTVLRLTNLKLDAANAFSISATYLAEDSQEASTHRYKFSKKEGEWLMTRCGWIE